MVAIKEVQAELSNFKRFGPGLVGVFVGGTAGIGQGTCRAFVRHAISPRVYLVGRNQEVANTLIEEFGQLNKDAKVSFIKSDVSLLKNVDEACAEIKSKEDKINLLCLSQGIMTMKGRQETAEGLDSKLCLHYYSRLRFAQNLMPLIQNAAASTSADAPRPLATVLSVLSGGACEGPVNIEDLQLKTNYGLMSCVRHSGTMNTLQLQNLAAKYANVSFVHTQPGGVDTNIGQGLGAFGAMAANVAAFLYKPWIQSINESGERQLYAASSDTFAKGIHLVGSSSTETDNSKVLKTLADEGVDKLVWDHTNQVFDEIAEKGHFA